MSPRRVAPECRLENVCGRVLSWRVLNEECSPLYPRRRHGILPFLCGTQRPPNTTLLCSILARGGAPTAERQRMLNGHYVAVGDARIDGDEDVEASRRRAERVARAKCADSRVAPAEIMQYHGVGDARIDGEEDEEIATYRAARVARAKAKAVRLKTDRPVASTDGDAGEANTTLARSGSAGGDDYALARAKAYARLVREAEGIVIPPPVDSSGGKARARSGNHIGGATVSTRAAGLSTTPRSGSAPLRSIAVVVAAVCGLAALSYRALPESAPSPPPPPAAAALGDGADASYYYAADRPPPAAQSALKQVDLVWRWLGWTASGAWLGSGPRPDRERGAGRRPGEDDGDLWAWASHNIGWLAGQLLHDALPPADTGHMATSRARSPREVRVAS